MRETTKAAIVVVLGRELFRWYMTDPGQDGCEPGSEGAAELWAEIEALIAAERTCTGCGKEIDDEEGAAFSGFDPSPWHFACAAIANRSGTVSREAYQGEIGKAEAQEWRANTQATHSFEARRAEWAQRVRRGMGLSAASSSWIQARDTTAPGDQCALDWFGIDQGQWDIVIGMMEVMKVTADVEAVADYIESIGGDS